MNNKTYLVKLTPGSFFFFGGENTLGGDEARNYLVKSNYFPQQTGLLGLLRYCILLQKDLLADPNSNKGLANAAIDLVGSSSFDPLNEKSYGIIQHISPIFLLDENGRKLLPAALNAGMVVQATAGSRVVVGQTIGTAHLLIAKNGKPYDPKHSLEEALAAEDGTTKPYSKVFEKHEQIGIQKNFRGTEQEGFYKQTSWYMPKGCFAFYANVEQPGDESPLPIDCWVATGGERSMFRFEAKAVDGRFEDIVRFALPAAALPADGLNKLVLLSDAYLPEGIYQHCAFAITDTTPFRYLRSNASTSRYFDLDRDAAAKLVDKPARSQRFTLLKKGSVLYPKPGQRQDLVDKLRRQTAFRKIGYNYFVEVPANNPISQ